LAEFLDVPFAVADATEYHRGWLLRKDVEVMIAELLHKCGQNVEEAQRGIVFIDRGGQDARRTHSARTGAVARDIGGEGVRRACSSCWKAARSSFRRNLTQHWEQATTSRRSTTQTFCSFAAGTFTDLRLYQENRTVGFGSTTAMTARSPPITEKELLDYGLLAEFLGRLPCGSSWILCRRMISSRS